MAPHIDPREVERTQRVIEELRLTLHRPELALQLRSINFAQPTAIDLRAWQGVTATVQSFMAFHQQHPFTVAPPGALSNGPFPLHAAQFADAQSVTIAPSSVQEHLAVIGRSGAGKTTKAQQIVHEAYRQGLSVATFDSKSDAAYLLRLYPETLLVGPSTPVALLEVPSWLSMPEHIALLTRNAKRAWWGGEGLLQVATESLQLTFAAHDRPTVTDWHAILAKLARKGDTYTRRDRIDGLRLRLERLIERYPGIANTPTGAGISPKDLCTGSLYFGSRIHTEVEDFLATWLLELRFSHHRAANIRQLHTLTHLDESLLFLHEDTITESASLAPTFPLFREFGIGVLLTANSYRSLPDAVKANIGTRIVMSLSDAVEHDAVSDTLGLNKEQREYLATKLVKGQCIIKTSEEWQLPILATFVDTKPDKAIGPDDWRTAEERTNRLARTPAPLLLTSTAAAKKGMTGWVTPAHVPSSSPLPTSAAAVLKPEKQPKIALNPNEERLLRFVAQRRVALTTEIDLHPEQVRRAKAKLRNLGLIREERIISRGGRGSSAVALAPTPAGYERIGVRSGGAGRGKLQHQYLALRIHRLLPDSRLEYSIGEKRVDLFLTYDPTKHEQLQRLVPMVALNPGDGIAIEIECSDPKKTAASNIAHNTDAGIVLTITATLPKHAEALRSIAPNVIDVFALLDRLEDEA